MVVCCAAYRTIIRREQGRREKVSRDAGVGVYDLFESRVRGGCAVSNGCMAFARSTLSGAQLDSIREYIRTHLATDIEVAELAGLVRLSPHYFSLLFRQAVGVPPHRYILLERISEAQRLLAAGGMTLAELATHLGFSDQSHFSRAFRKVTGTTPGSYQPDLVSLGP